MLGGRRLAYLRRVRDGNLSPIEDLRRQPPRRNELRADVPFGRRHGLLGPARLAVGLRHGKGRLTARHRVVRGALLVLSSCCVFGSVSFMPHVFSAYGVPAAPFFVFFDLLFASNRLNWSSFWETTLCSWLSGPTARCSCGELITPNTRACGSARS